MRALPLVPLAILGAIAIACGTDNHGLPGTEKYPTATSCPGTKALVPEDMAGSKLVAKTLVLTFDSGPSEATAQIESFLNAQQIRATFFINGQNVSGFESTLDQLAADGHLLGNRTQGDDDVTMLSAADLVKSVTDTDAFLSTAPARTPADKLFFRPPFGSWNEAAQKALSASPMTKYTGPVGWDMGDSLDDKTGSDSECWDPEAGATAKTVDECSDLFLKQIRAKMTGIVLFHDGPPGANGAKTADMIAKIIPTLKGEGFKFARMDEIKLVPRSATFPGDDPDTGGTSGGTTADGGTAASEDPCANLKK